MNTATLEQVTAGSPDAEGPSTVLDPHLGAIILPLDALRESPNNPRRHFDLAQLAELKASIAESGLYQPLLVRPMFNSEDGELEIYEIVAGARRFRAVMELGMSSVPCLSREMSDEEAREAQIVENLQRADVHPVEEAEAFGELLERLGSIAAVAAKLGKEQSYVAKCLRLLKLTLHSRDAMRGGLITIEHALLLARLAETEQNAALKWCLDHSAGSKTTVEKVLAERMERRAQETVDKEEGGGSRWHYVWEPQSVIKLKLHIEAESGIILSRAPWSLTDEDYLLPDVGPCAECEKNTKANAPLFGDLDIGDPTCTDGACFAAKVSGFVQIEMRKAGFDDTSKPKVLVPRLSWKTSSVRPATVPNDGPNHDVISETANPAKVLKYGQWIDAKKGSCPNVRPGVTTDWSDSGDRGHMGSGKKLRMPGETILVCIAVGCKVHPKAWEKQAKSSNGNQREQRAEAVENVEDKAKREAAVVAEKELRLEIYRIAASKVKPERILREMVDDDMPWDDDDQAQLCQLLGLPDNLDGKLDDEKRLHQYLKAATLPQLFAMAFHIDNMNVLEVPGHFAGAAIINSRKSLLLLASDCGVAKEAKAIVDRNTKKPAAKKAAAKKPAKKTPAKKVAAKKKASK